MKLGQNVENSAEVAHQFVTYSLKMLRKETYVRFQIRISQANDVNLSWCRYLSYIDTLFMIRAIPEVIEICKEALQEYPGDVDLRNELRVGEEAYCDIKEQIKDMLPAQGLTLDQYAWGMTAVKLYYGLHRSYKQEILKQLVPRTSC
jgi:hypothetical protein